MRERILLAPSANSTELMRMLARYGTNTLGLRIMNGTELAEYVLMKAGRYVKEKYLDMSSQTALIYQLLLEKRYFPVTSYADAQNVAAALLMVRQLVTDNEEETVHEKLKQGEFPKNSNALSEIYDDYKATIGNKGLIDSIDLIRRAISQEYKIKAELLTLKEYSLSPLEHRLAECIADRIIDTDMCGLAGIKTKPLKYNGITEAYGAANEVEDIISTIYESKLPLDKCLIALAEPLRYSQLTYEIADQYGIPVTFGCGLPIMNSYPAQVLNDLLFWHTDGYCGTDALSSLIHNRAFDEQKLRDLLRIQSNRELDTLIKSAGNLRLCCDAKVNSERLKDYKAAYPENTDIYEKLCILAAELQRGVSYIVTEYSRIREGNAGKLDASALAAICRELDSFAAFSEIIDIKEIIPEILSMSVCSENSKGSALHVCTISQALSCVRENMFIAGMSASNFPGSPAENYLVTDNDMLLFGTDVPTSENMIIRNKQKLFDLLSFASAIGSEIRLSYSGFDTAELKEENASSALFELYCECNADKSMKGFDNALRHVTFFDNNIGISNHIGRAYNNGDEIAYNTETSNSYIGVSNDIVLSPSSVEVYFSCPRMFYYSAILGLEVEETDDVFTVISPKELGTLIHKLMDSCAKNSLSPDELYKLAQIEFDRFIASRPPINKIKCEEIRSQYIRMVLTGQVMSGDNEIIESEMYIEPVEIGGIKLKGRLDRLEKNSDGEYIIADFKTGSRIVHNEEDTATCLQVLLYALMLKKCKNISVSRCEYRYLRHKKAIACSVSEQTENELITALGELSTALERGDFPPSGDCKYCDYKNICRKEEIENG